MTVTQPLRAAPERWNHGPEPYEVGDGRQRVSNGVVALYKAGKISGADVASAGRWYRDYALGVHGVFDCDGRAAGGGDAHTAGFARAKAKAAHDAALTAVGADGAVVLRRFVADGVALMRLSSEIMLGRNEVVGAVVFTLRRLTQHYAATAPIGRPGRILSADFSA